MLKVYKSEKAMSLRQARQLRRFSQIHCLCLAQGAVTLPGRQPL